MDEKKTTELLSEIRDTLNQINNRQFFIVDWLFDIFDNRIDLKC